MGLLTFPSTPTSATALPPLILHPSTTFTTRMKSYGAILPAPVPLTFIIVGGSIAGFATAFALQHAGHRAIVLEATSGKRRGCGPTRSPPNMTKVFERWGLSDELRRRGIVCTAINMRDGESGEVLGGQKLSRIVMSQFGADFIALQHGDLHDILRESALAAGATIRTMTPVSHVDSRGPAVVLSSGERIRCDVVIGADGAQGVMRKLVLGRDVAGASDERYVYNFSLPLDALKRDLELRHLSETADWQIFMGNNCCMQSCTSPSRNEYLVVLKAPAHGNVSFDEGWDDSLSVDAIQPNMDGLGAVPRKLVKMARQVVPTVHCAYEPFEQWLNEENNVVLIGDAAHPQVPSGSQACAMAIEDAATLGDLFSRLSHHSQIASLLSAYEDIRQPRCAEIQESERQKTDFVCLPVGDPDRAARDAGTRAAAAAHILELEDADEEVVAANWGDYVTQWAHDAGEAVEDWWTKWGTMFERAGGNAADKSAINVHLEVSSEIKHTWA